MPNSATSFVCGLLVDVPWSAWDGYENGSGYEIGTVWRYGLFEGANRFLVRFPNGAECADFGMSWPQLLGEELMPGSGERAHLCHII